MTGQAATHEDPLLYLFSQSLSPCAFHYLIFNLSTLRPCLLVVFVFLKISSEMAVARESTNKLAGELGKLLVVVKNNQCELDSHVKSSQAFIKMAAEQQVVFFSFNLASVFLDCPCSIYPSGTKGSFAGV